MSKDEDLLAEVNERLKELEHQAEIIKTVLIVREPNTLHASQAYDGLRKQVAASAAERRAHLTQLATMAVAVSRARTVADLAPQVAEWMTQAGVISLRGVPKGHEAEHLFEDIGGQGLDGELEILEAAYVDGQTGSLLRPGRARLAPGGQRTPAPETDVTETDTEPPAGDSPEEETTA